MQRHIKGNHLLQISTPATDKRRGRPQYEETDTFFSSNKRLLDTRIKQISSDRTKRGLSQFIWQLLSFVVAILNSSFYQVLRDPFLPQMGAPPLPNETSSEDAMSRQEGEWWKDKRGGWGGGSVSSVWERGAVVTRWPLTEMFQVKLLSQPEATQVSLWFGVRRSNTPHTHTSSPPHAQM